MTRSSKPLWPSLAALLLAACASGPKTLPDPPADDTPAPVAGGAKTPVPKPGTAAAPLVVKDPQQQFEEALAALKAKKLPEARAGFEQLAKQHPEFSGPLTNLAILDAKADADSAAIANFSKAVVANPRNAIAYNWLGILYRERKDYAKAEVSYLKALDLTPSNAAIVLNLGILYDVYLKRPEDALARYREYQRMTGNRELKVTAWIKQIEATLPPPAPEQPAPAAAVKAKT